MKIYISADMEGITGVTSWSEVDINSPDYLPFVQQMSKETAAACLGAQRAGAEEIWVKDAHETARNIDPQLLPENAKLIRGWAGHPFSMVQGLDESFDALIFIGYHSGAGSKGSPLAHTMNPEDIDYIKINGQYVSEFLINAYTAAAVGVPVVFASGDKELCDEVEASNRHISTVAVKEGVGNSSISIQPGLAVKLIEAGVEQALRGDLELCKLELPRSFNVELGYRDHSKAYRYSYYPGIQQISPHCLLYQTEDYFEVLRMMMFLT